MFIEDSSEIRSDYKQLYSSPYKDKDDPLYLFDNPANDFQENFLLNFKESPHKDNSILNGNCSVLETQANKKINDSLSTLSSVNSNNKSNFNQLKVNLKNEKQIKDNIKRGRPMADKALIIDEINNVVYDADADPEEYRKARKRMQNRESAIRSRMKKKDSSLNNEKEIELLRNDNYRLNLENATLRKENVMLHEQMKFLKSLLQNSKANEIEKEKKVNESVSQSSCTLNQRDIEKNEKKDESKYYFSSNKKTMSKVFMVCLICIISLSLSNEKDYSLSAIEDGYSITMKEEMAQPVKNRFNYKKFIFLAFFVNIAFLFILTFYTKISNKIIFMYTKSIKNS